MNTLKRDLQKCLPSSGSFLFHDIGVQMFKNSEKEEIQCEVVELDHVYKTNDYTDFKIETVANFPLPFNEFYISQDSFKDMVDKYVVNISLTDGVIKHIEYSTRGQQSYNLRWEYRREKLTASNFYIAVVNKVEPSEKLFYSSVKTSSMKHGIGDESVTLTEYVTLLTSESVTINLFQLGIKVTSFSWGIT